MCIPEFRLTLMAHNIIAIDRSDRALWMKQNLRSHSHMPQLHRYTGGKTENYWGQPGLPPVSAHANKPNYHLIMIVQIRRKWIWPGYTKRKTRKLMPVKSHNIPTDVPVTSFILVCWFGSGPSWCGLIDWVVFVSSPTRRIKEKKTWKSGKGCLNN